MLEDYAATDKIIKSSKELLKKTIDGDEEAVAKALDESHINATSNRSYNNEDALQSAIRQIHEKNTLPAWNITKGICCS